MKLSIIFLIDTPWYVSLRQLHRLDMTEDDIDKSWQCINVLKYAEEKEVYSITKYNCLVERNEMNKTHSWVNFFALNLRNLTPIISFARKDTYLDKIPFCHLIQYLKSKPSKIITKAQKVSANITDIKYKF
jgi:hypothetical protein